MSNRVFNSSGVLLQEWNDATRTYHDYVAGTSRPYTADENAVADVLAIEQTKNANESTLLDRAVTALASNSTYLALSSPTAAQNTAQIKALTRQMNAVIRLVTKRTEATD